MSFKIYEKKTNDPSFYIFLNTPQQKILFKNFKERSEPLDAMSSITMSRNETDFYISIRAKSHHVPSTNIHLKNLNQKHNLAQISGPIFRN